MNKVKPVIGRVGGKARIASWILEFIKQHNFSIYCEPFLGSAALYFALINEGIPEQIKKRGRHFRAVLNDADKEIMNLYRTVRDYPELLAFNVYFTPYSRAEHKQAQQRGEGDLLESARLSLVGSWQSMANGDGWVITRDTAGSRVVNGVSGGSCNSKTPNFFSTIPTRILSASPHLGEPETLDPMACLNETGRQFIQNHDVDLRVEWVRRYLVDGWQSFRRNPGGSWALTQDTQSDCIVNGKHIGGGKMHCEDFSNIPTRILSASPHLQESLDQLKKVYLECDDAIKVMERWSTPETLFYLDPPYVGVEDYYAHNAKQSKADNLDMHHRLAAIANTVEAAGVIVSYYPNDLLDELYPSDTWERHYRETVASSAGITRQSKTRTRPKRTELLLVRKRQGDAPKVALSGQMSFL